MSVEAKHNGQLRLRCDDVGCSHKFVPLRPLLDARELRKRAELYGWSFTFGRDLCPSATKQQTLGGVR